MVKYGFLFCFFLIVPTLMTVLSAGRGGALNAEGRTPLLDRRRVRASPAPSPEPPAPNPQPPMYETFDHTADLGLRIRADDLRRALRGGGRAVLGDRGEPRPGAARRGADFSG